VSGGVQASTGSSKEKDTPVRRDSVKEAKDRGASANKAEAHEAGEREEKEREKEKGARKDRDKDRERRKDKKDDKVSSYALKAAHTSRFPARGERRLTDCFVCVCVVRVALLGLGLLRKAHQGEAGL
jgi:hypothetical protein